MKCHYEVLGVPQNASDEDIKKAYKKLALRWHPDKNLDSVEEAKDQFLLVQQAFELLSDPHERAWYDRRRDEILIGRSKDGYVDNSLDLFQFFNPCAYKGYGDDEKGFYTVFRCVFQTIAKEEMAFSKDIKAPEFGKSDSPYDKVVQPFYSFWQSFVTKKSFCWLDPYDAKSAPNRAVLRMIEKENKKIRDKARKQRTEEVRALVAFVRKRDKRVQAQVEIMKIKAEENKKKMEEYRLKRLKEQNKALLDYKESDWGKFSNIESELRSVEANVVSQFGEDSDSCSSDSEKEGNIESLYCSVCNKLFKSIKQFMNHEQSKKHKEKVDRFKISTKTSATEKDCDNKAAEKIEAKKKRFQRYGEESSGCESTDDSATDSELLLEQCLKKAAVRKTKSDVNGAESKKAPTQKSKHKLGSDLKLSSSECNELNSPVSAGSKQFSASTLESGVATTSPGVTPSSSLSDGLEISCVDLNEKKVSKSDCVVHIKCRVNQSNVTADFPNDQSSFSQKNSSVCFDDNAPRSCDNFQNDGECFIKNLSSSESESSSSADYKSLCKFCCSDKSCVENCNHCLGELERKKKKQKELKLISKCHEDVASDELLNCTVDRMKTLKIDSMSSYNSHNYLAPKVSGSNELKRTHLEKSNSHEAIDSVELGKDSKLPKDRTSRKKKGKHEKNKTSDLKDKNRDKPLAELMSEIDSAGLSKKQRRKLEQQNILMQCYNDSVNPDLNGTSKKDLKKKSAKKSKNSVTDINDDSKNSLGNQNDKNVDKSAAKAYTTSSIDSVEIENGSEKSKINADSERSKCSVDSEISKTSVDSEISKTSVDYERSKTSVDSEKSKSSKGSDISLHYCLGCNTGFSSKNKLYEHLRTTKHALPIVQEVRNVKKTKKSKLKQ